MGKRDEWPMNNSQCPWMGARSLSEAQILYSQIADSIFTHRPGFCSELESFMLEERSDETGIPSDLRIYPNPATDIIFMNLPKWVEVVEILSLDGRRWSQLLISNGGIHTLSINDIPSGIYTIKTQGGKQVETKQLFITQ